MDPFQLKPQKADKIFTDWKKVLVKAYDKNAVDPYTRLRVILMSGTEFESVRLSHAITRMCPNNDVRRRLAYMRRGEQLQQKRVASLKPADESILEHTIGYEQLAVDLTANLAVTEQNGYVKQQLEFALLEDFDHLYRYADYLDAATGEKAEELVGRYTEIMPGRPTVAHHRHPADTVRRPMTGVQPATIDLLAANVITAAEQQTMNYYMNTAALWPEETGRRLYQEIGMVEEQHVTQYGSLLDPRLTWLENLLVHQYVECWLYWSCAETESNSRIRGLWQALFEQELLHLDIAQNLLRSREGKQWQQVIPDGEFPPPLRLESNIDYIRGILGQTAYNTAVREDYQDARTLGPDSSFAAYQRAVNRPLGHVVSHAFMQEYMDKNGRDYRFETAPHPIEPLRTRTRDNTQVGLPDAE